MCVEGRDADVSVGGWITILTSVVRGEGDVSCWLSELSPPLILLLLASLSLHSLPPFASICYVSVTSVPSTNVTDMVDQYLAYVDRAAAVGQYADNGAHG